jgi:6-phosphofructokinase 1
VDNDLNGTYFSLGFPTGAKCLADFVSEIKKDAAYTLSRIFIVETIGMSSGWLAAASAYGDADVIIPPEKKVSLEKVIRLVAERYEKNNNFAVVVIAQEANFDQPLLTLHDDQFDQYKTSRSSYICLALREKIKSVMGNVTVKALYPGNFIQTGSPIPLDRDLAIQSGQKAVELLEQEKFGQMVNIVRPNEHNIQLETASIPLENVTGYRHLPEEYFDWENLQVTDKFLNYLEPILGKYQKEKDDPYYQLIKKINS